MKYTAGQKIWHIEINRWSEPQSRWSHRKDGITIEELEILGVSKYKLVLNNDWFTTLDNDDREGYKKDHSSYRYIDDISVNIRTSGSILGDGIFITLYSTKEPTEKILNKMVAKTSNEINKKYGWLFSGVVKELYEMVKTKVDE